MYFNSSAKEELPFLVQKLGGVDDFITDMFGQKFDICPGREGWEEKQLKRVIDLEFTTHLRMSWVPRYYTH